MINRYISFSGFDYSPFGGFNDFIGGFDAYEEAKNAVISHMKIYGIDETFGHVVDLKTGERWDAPE